ncbi:MAG: hypothetical protein WCH40_13650, partial [Verrucomicrobiales bacterium]
MKKRWLVVAVMVMVGLIFAVLSQLKDPPSYAATLSDGTIVRLAKVGVGAMSYDSYPPLKAALAGYVPNRFQSRLGERTKFTFNTQSDELGLLFLFRTPADQPKRDVTQFLSRIEFVESTGFVFKVGVSGYSSFGSVM